MERNGTVRPLLFNRWLLYQPIDTEKRANRALEQPISVPKRVLMLQHERRRPRQGDVAKLAAENSWVR